MRLNVNQFRTAILPVALALAGAAYGQVTIPATFALPSSAADTTKPGFLWNVSEVAAGEPNILSWAEGQLAGQEGPNLADPNAQSSAVAPASPASPATAPISFIIPDVINFTIDSDHAATGLNSEVPMPGLPGTTGSSDNIAAEVLTYLDLPAGPLTMVVRSDDGFRLTIGGAVPSDRYSSSAVVAGSYDGGRGADDTVMQLNITKAGLYAARMLYENGGGNASVEWYTQDSQGNNTLINDTATPGAIKAYRAVTTPAVAAYISSVIPSPDSTEVSPQPAVTVAIADGPTPVSASTIALSVNGTVVTPSITRSGKVTTVSYTPSVFLTAASLQTASVTYVDAGKTNQYAWSFSTAFYPSVTPNLAVAPNVNKPGFKVRVFANSSAVRNNEAFNNDFRDFAEQSLNGIFADWSAQTTTAEMSGAVVLPLAPNLANPASVGSAIAAGNAAGASVDFEVAGTINFDSTTTPGLPATDGSIDQANLEILTYVALPAGLTTFAVSSPDLYRAYVGSWDYTAGITAAHLNTFGAPDTSFFVYAPTAGVYPVRFVYNHIVYKSSVPSLSIYTIAPGSTNRALLNDTTHGGLAAYRALAAPTEPYIRFTSPSPVLHQLIHPSYAFVVSIADGDIGLDDSSPVLTLDGKVLSVTKSRAGDTLTLTYNPTTLQVPTEIHTATLSFKDKNGVALSKTWSFMNLKAIWLPTPTLALYEDFESYPADGTVFNTPPDTFDTNNWRNPVQPDSSKWYVYSYTYQESDAGGEDLTRAHSDSYMSFVVAPFDTFAGIEGDSKAWLATETVNGVPLGTSVGSGNIFIAESDNRSGGVRSGQVQFAYSKAYDLTSFANPVVSFAAIRKQNQDDIATMEYSVDGGKSWLPVYYSVDGASFHSSDPDAFVNADGSMDAVKTMTIAHGDAPIWVDNKGVTRGGNYGDGIAATISQALGPFIAPRINDDNFDGKRIEAIRLPLAAHKKDVRLRLSQLGTCSWYWGIDNLGFYDIAASGAQVPTGRALPAPVLNGVSYNGVKITVSFANGTLQYATNPAGPWTSTSNATGSFSEAPAGAKFFRVIQ